MIVFQVLLTQVFALAALMQLVAAGESCESENALAFKFDCHPEKGANLEKCVSRGCCWQQESSGEPKCFFPPERNCYSADLIQEARGAATSKKRPTEFKTKQSADDEETFGWLLERNQEAPTAGAEAGENDLEEAEAGNKLKLRLTRKPACPASGFVDDARELEVEVSVYEETLINIKISEPDKPARFVPKLPELSLPARNAKSAARRLTGEKEWKNNNNNNNNNNFAGTKHNAAPDDDGKFHQWSIAAGKHLQLVVESGNAPGNSSGSRLALKVIHLSSRALLFETDLGKLIYSKQFIQLPIELPSWYVYGLGQHLSLELLKRQEQEPKRYTMFNYAHPPKADGRHSYSSFPFYINLAKLGELQTNNNNNSDFERSRKVMALGGLMLNSMAMEAVLEPLRASNGAERERGAISWRLTGGIVDFYLFLGPQPHDVVRQYQTLVGLPALPPAWTLGYHQSRMGYNELLNIKLAWARTRGAAIPMESIWTDIEFLWRRTSYALGEPELAELVEAFKETHEMHYVSIADPAISLTEPEDLYKALKIARQMNIFPAYLVPAHNNNNNNNNNNNSKAERITAQVTTWTESGKSALIDFTDPRAVDYLKQVLADYKKKLHFDGLWLDKNEPEVYANNNDYHHKELANDQSNSCPFDERLSYEPGERSQSDRTLCMSAQFHAGQHNQVHNLFAFYQSMAHYKALKSLEPTRRPFIISRAQFVGQGSYSGTWLGDLDSSFDHLRWSLIGTIESNLFGLPLVGADICGFFGHTSDELCARWFSLGAFYPFARNHNDGSAKDQDPGALGELVQSAARVALMRRYSLLPYLYTLFYLNHLKGEPVVASPLFQFFDQYHTTTEHLHRLPQLNDQMMLGPALMIAPIMEVEAESRYVHLAPGLWYDISIGLPGTEPTLGHYEALRSNWPVRDEQGNYKLAELDDYARKRINNLHRPKQCAERYGCWLSNQYTPLGAINLYLRGGRIVPTFRRVSHTKGINSLWKEAAFFLEIGLDEQQSAYGSLYWDDGKSQSELEKYNVADFWLASNRLTMALVLQNDASLPPLKFEGFVVYGQKSFNDKAKLENLTPYDENVSLRYTYDSDKQILTCLFVSSTGEEIRALSLDRFDNLTFKW